MSKSKAKAIETPVKPKQKLGNSDTKQKLAMKLGLVRTNRQAV